LIILVFTTGIRISSKYFKAFKLTPLGTNTREVRPSWDILAKTIKLWGFEDLKILIFSLGMSSMLIPYTLLFWALYFSSTVNILLSENSILFDLAVVKRRNNAFDLKKRFSKFAAVRFWDLIFFERFQIKVLRECPLNSGLRHIHFFC